MTQLLVMTFDELESAKQARRALNDLQKQRRVSVEDAAVISRDTSGKTHVHNEVDGDVKLGAGVGALVGLVLGFGFPLLGLALGAGGGALVGKLADRGLDTSFVREVEAALQPGASALAVVFTNADPAALRAALQPFGGRIYETTISPELADQLRSALKA